MAVHLGLARHVGRLPRAQRSERRARRQQPWRPAPAPTSGTRSGSRAYVHYISLWARRFLRRHRPGRGRPRCGRGRAALRGPSATSARTSGRRTRSTRTSRAPYVAEPFRVPDCTIEVDGACAVVVSDLDAARDLAQPPVVLEGAAYARRPGAGPRHGRLDVLGRPVAQLHVPPARADLWGSAGHVARRRRAGRDLRLLHEHRADGPRGSRARRSGWCAASSCAAGDLPTNTHGGLLAEGYLHGMNTVAEAVLQLQGRAGTAHGRHARDLRRHVRRADGRLGARAGGRSVIPPAGDVDAEPFWAALADGTLLVSVCESCGHRWLPPLATCPRCASRVAHERRRCRRPARSTRGRSSTAPPTLRTQARCRTPSGWSSSPTAHASTGASSASRTTTCARASRSRCG